MSEITYTEPFNKLHRTWYQCDVGQKNWKSVFYMETTWEGGIMLIFHRFPWNHPLFLHTQNHSSLQVHLLCSSFVSQIQKCLIQHSWQDFVALQLLISHISMGLGPPEERWRDSCFFLFFFIHGYISKEIKSVMLILKWLLQGLGVVEQPCLTSLYLVVFPPNFAQYVVYV